MNATGVPKSQLWLLDNSTGCGIMAPMKKLKKYVVTICVLVEAEDVNQAFAIVEDDLNEMDWPGYEAFSVRSVSVSAESD